MGKQCAIEINSLTKQFGSIPALEDIDLSIRTGEVFGLLGPNGAGKSTLIDLILGLTTPSNGQANIFGNSITSNPRSIRNRIGVLPEKYAIYSDMSGREQLQAIAQLKNTSAELEHLREKVGLESEAFDRPADTYSKGMQQRLVLAMALIGDPDLLILDEPMSGLDPTGITLVRDLIQEQAANGTTVFFSSHRLGEVEAVCDRVGILSDGHLLSVEDVSSLSNLAGESEQLRLFTDKPPEAKLIKRLRSIDSIRDIHLEDCLLTFECMSPGAKADAIEYVNQACSVHDFEVNKLDLEDIFDATIEHPSSGPSIAAGTDIAWEEPK